MRYTKYSSCCKRLLETGGDFQWHAIFRSENQLCIGFGWSMFNGIVSELESTQKSGCKHFLFQHRESLTCVNNKIFLSIRGTSKSLIASHYRRIFLGDNSATILIPMQFRGPALKGTKAKGCLPMLSSVRNRSGLNTSGSGKYSSFR